MSTVKDCVEGRHDWWPIPSESVERKQCSMCHGIVVVGDRSRCMIYADER